MPGVGIPVSWWAMLFGGLVVSELGLAELLGFRLSPEPAANW